jgi:hypothetical protein
MASTCGRVDMGGSPEGVAHSLWWVGGCQPTSASGGYWITALRQPTCGACHLVKDGPRATGVHVCLTTPGGHNQYRGSRALAREVLVLPACDHLHPEQHHRLAPGGLDMKFNLCVVFGAL